MTNVIYILFFLLSNRKTTLIILIPTICSHFNHPRRTCVKYLIVHRYAVSRYNDFSACNASQASGKTRAERFQDDSSRGISLPVTAHSPCIKSQRRPTEVLSVVARTGPSGPAWKRCNNVAVAHGENTNGRSGYTRKLDRKVQQGL